MPPSAANHLQRRYSKSHSVDLCVHAAGRLDSLVPLVEEGTEQSLEKRILLSKCQRIDVLGDAVIPAAG
jgi:hypothetical protein